MSTIATGWHQLPDEQYFSLPAVGSHDLMRVLRSPRHAQVKVEDSPALVMGRLVHSAVLNPTTTWLIDVAVYPDVDRRTKDGKEAWAAFQLEHKGKTWVTNDDMNTILAVQDAIRSHSTASKVLAEGIPEMAGIFDSDGITYRIKPDWRRQDGILVDLKTCQDASPKAFSRSIANFNYHMQAAYYLDVANLIDGRGSYDTWIWIAVEKEPPYGVAVYHADRNMIERGRDLCKRALEVWTKCSETKTWPGYPDTVQNISLPQYAYFD